MAARFFLPYYKDHLHESVFWLLLPVRAHLTVVILLAESARFSTAKTDELWSQENPLET